MDITVHPSHESQPEDDDLFRCFFAWRGGDLGGGCMPFSGGFAEQPAALMDAFVYLSGAYSLIPKATDT